MVTVGPLYPGTVANDAAVGTKAWTNPSNAGADDATYATATGYTAGENTQWLKATNFGFSIPAGSVINTVTVEVQRIELAGLNRSGNRSQKVVLAGTPSGSDFGSAANFPSSEVIDTYNPTGLTVANINDSGFGFAVECGDSGGANGNTGVDFIRITVDYTPLAMVTGDSAPPVRRVAGWVNRLGGFAFAPFPIVPEVITSDKWTGSYEPVANRRLDVRARLGGYAIDPARLLDTELAQVDKWLPSADPVPNRRRVPVRTGLTTIDPGAYLIVLMDKWVPSGDPRPNVRRRSFWQGWVAIDPRSLLVLGPVYLKRIPPPGFGAYPTLPPAGFGKATSGPDGRGVIS